MHTNEDTAGTVEPSARPARPSRLAFRRQLRQRSWWLVDKLLPGNTVHLISGASGAGKTTFLFQLMYDWEHGRPVLGCNSNPVPWAYVSIDRPTWETDKTLCRMGLADWDAPIYSMADLFPDLTNAYDIDKILEHPHLQYAQLLVIEGLQSLLPDTKPGQGQNKVEQIWMAQLLKRIEYSSRSIIAVTHQPKGIKKSHEYTSSRTDYLGSASVGGSSSTIVNIWPYTEGDTVECSQRLIKVNGRDFAEFYMLYDVNEDGLLVNPKPWTGKQQTQLPFDDVSAPKGAAAEFQLTETQASLDFWALSQPSETPWTAQDALNFAGAHAISRATVYRWLSNAQSRGVIRKIDYGRYVKVITSDPTNGQPVV